MCPWDSLAVASLENPQPGTSVGFFKHVGSKRVRKGNIFTWRWWCGVPPVPPRLHLYTPKEMPPPTDGTSLLTQSKPVGRKLKHPHTAPWRQTGHETCLNCFLKLKVAPGWDSSQGFKRATCEICSDAGTQRVLGLASRHKELPKDKVQLPC